MQYRFSLTSLEILISITTYCLNNSEFSRTLSSLVGCVFCPYCVDPCSFPFRAFNTAALWYCEELWREIRSLLLPIDYMMSSTPSILPTPFNLRVPHKYAFFRLSCDGTTSYAILMYMRHKTKPLKTYDIEHRRISSHMHRGATGKSEDILHRTQKLDLPG